MDETAAIVCLLQTTPLSQSARLGDQLEASGSAFQLQPVAAAAQLAQARRALDAWQAQGIRVISVLDQDYPPNLRRVVDRPAALYVQGELRQADSRAVAIVGTRQATPDGRRRAARLAKTLAREGVTVVSGLARGIDSAAHGAALQAEGRTLAVLGTGLRHYYPPENAPLQRQIARSGAVISQFPPDFSGTRYSFPLRNKIISGLSLVSVVVEAAESSGAKIEAQAALKHGRPLFLMRSLVEQQEWAKAMADLPNVSVLTGEEQILRALGPTPE